MPRSRSRSPYSSIYSSRYGRAPSRITASMSTRSRSRSRSSRSYYPLYRGPKVNIRGIHSFKRFHNYTGITLVNGTTNTYGVLNFRLEDIPSYTEFTNLFDCFRIKRIKVMFIPTSNVTLSPDTAANDVFKSTEYANRLFTVLDFNDSTAPTSIDTLRQYDTCRMTPNNIIHKRYFKPKYSAEVNLGSYQSSDHWLETATSADVVHLGIKYGITHQTLTVSNEVYKIETVFYMQFKNVR